MSARQLLQLFFDQVADDLHEIDVEIPVFVGALEHAEVAERVALPDRHLVPLTRVAVVHGAVSPDGLGGGSQCVVGIDETVVRVQDRRCQRGVGKIILVGADERRGGSNGEADLPRRRRQ
mgnify:CR=1 FL=1